MPKVFYGGCHEIPHLGRFFKLQEDGSERCTFIHIGKQSNSLYEMIVAGVPIGKYNFYFGLFSVIIQMGGIPSEIKIYSGLSEEDVRAQVVIEAGAHKYYINATPVEAILLGLYLSQNNEGQRVREINLSEHLLYFNHHPLPAKLVHALEMSDSQLLPPRYLAR